MTAAKSHRLDGLEPDNLLAFLALLGLLRALEAIDAGLYPRASWDIDRPPLRPRLVLAREVTAEQISGIAAEGIETIAAGYEFEDRKDLNYSQKDCRKLLRQEATASCAGRRERIDLLASLMSDAAIKDDKTERVDPTPLCLLFGQGHQHFLERLAGVPREAAPPPRGKGRSAVALSASECLAEALFQPWRRDDPTFSFRWDPAEDVRYSLMAGDPTDAAYKARTQHGANRLAAVGLGALTLVPKMRAGRVRPTVIGGMSGVDGFSFAFPIWRNAATLAAIRALLSHPGLRKSEGLKHLEVDHVVVAQRIPVGKFMNFSRARLLEEYAPIQPLELVAQRIAPGQGLERVGGAQLLNPDRSTTPLAKSKIYAALPRPISNSAGMPRPSCRRLTVGSVSRRLRESTFSTLSQPPTEHEPGGSEARAPRPH